MFLFPISMYVTGVSLFSFKDIFEFYFLYNCTLNDKKDNILVPKCMHMTGVQNHKHIYYMVI